MNKTAIKNFAVWARRKLIEDIVYKAKMLGITEQGISEPLAQSTEDLQFFDIGTKNYAEVSGKEIAQRNSFVRAIKRKEASSDYKTAFQYVVEEVAYTWFNRLIAIRFMEVNDYLPSHVRVLSSEKEGKTEPDLVTNPFESDLDFTTEEQDLIMQLKDENKLDDLFRMLFIKQCNKLHEILPELFEKTDDYTELLLTISFTDTEGVIHHLINDISENDFNVEMEGQVEIIGWMYQYYNIEPKDETFALLKKNIKITKERIPAATQLFTPDWIVRYMVENSLGRLWIKRNAANARNDEDEYPGDINEILLSNWKYYLEESEQEPEVDDRLTEIYKEYRNLNPEDIKVIDPCMGSGHILVYAFDVLMQIYESQGYTQRDAVQYILENNLFGLDIDNRAAQLAYFAVMMKARQYDRRILGRGVRPHVYAIEESNGINRAHLKYFGTTLSPIEKNTAEREMIGLLDTMRDAKEYGSILNVENYNWDLLNQFLEDTEGDDQLSIDMIGIEKTQAELRRLVEIGQIMTQKYHTTVTNPPYMSSSSMDAKLSDFVKKNYPDSKSDLFAVFIERCGQMTKNKGYQAMITQHAWMFLSSYEKLREKLLLTDTVNMAHLGARAFDEIGGEVVQTTSFVFRGSHLSGYKGTYCRLIEPTTQQGKEDMFLAGKNRYTAQQDNFSKIPGSPIAYWANKNIGKAFSEAKTIDEIGASRSGMQTGDNNRFLRLWFEVDHNKMDCSIKTQEDCMKSKGKWIPQPKGGTFRRWYGNLDYVVNFEDNGRDLRNFEGTSIIKNPQFYFREGVSWSHTTSKSFSARYMPAGCIFNVEAPTFYPNTNTSLKYVLGFLNTKVLDTIFGYISQTMHYMAGDMAKIPVKFTNNPQLVSKVECLVDECIEIAKREWDSYEYSWKFNVHPLVLSVKVPDWNGAHKATLSDSYAKWEALCDECFNKLKANEGELNRIFIDIYGLQDELTSEVNDDDVTVRKADLKRDIKSLISYAVGCMFGRYSLDEPGLVYAGGEWDESKYSTFIPDVDNCIPITDEEYFKDDIVGLFCAWLKKVYGTETLEENLDFIANALGNKGNTSREVIRNYFLNDFFKDHCTTYSVTGSGKRPIYWLFDSGKNNGFKALVYMHRWNEDTIGNLRVEYLHRMQHVYEKEIDREQEKIDHGANNREINAAKKRKEKLQKQLKETKEYDAKVAHLALSRINIDLDDGVKVNYQKVQTDKDGKNLGILAKI